MERTLGTKSLRENSGNNNETLTFNRRIECDSDIESKRKILLQYNEILMESWMVQNKIKSLMQEKTKYISDISTNRTKMINMRKRIDNFYANKPIKKQTGQYDYFRDTEENYTLLKNTVEHLSKNKKKDINAINTKISELVEIYYQKKKKVIEFHDKHY